MRMKDKVLPDLLLRYALTVWWPSDKEAGDGEKIR